MTKVLRIDASMRHAGSTTRMLTDEVISRLAPEQVIVRDLSQEAELIDETWIGSNFTPADDRIDEQKARLALSDELIMENQVARAGVTFKYTETGPVGLLEGKRAIVVIATGGTPVDSEIDFATPYLRHVLGFIGIHDVTVIAADRQMVDADAAIAKATDGISQVAA